MKLEELYLVHEHREKVQAEREEQRHIREQMREEEKALREIEKAKEDAEREEAVKSKALEKARQEICVPTFMLKILPSYEKRPRICELVRSEITNISVKGARRGASAAPRKLMARLHRLANRAGLSEEEVHILRGIARAVDERCR